MILLFLKSHIMIHLEEMGVIKQSEHPAKTAGTLQNTTHPESCKLSFLSAWLLHALSYFQKAHVAFTAFLIKVKRKRMVIGCFLNRSINEIFLLIFQTNEAIAKRFLALLPFLLYLSLLVLVAQGVFISGLLMQTLPPLGMVFQLTCIAMMGVVFCYTSPSADYPSHPKSD